MRAGTFAPERRASDKPIAIACFGFVTLRPLPLFSLPRLNSCISRSTFFWARGPYLRPEDFLPRLLEDDVRFFAAVDRVRELAVPLRRERDALVRFAALRFVPGCDELRFAAVLRPRDRDPLPRDDPLRDERLRVDFFVAAIESSLLFAAYYK